MLGIAIVSYINTGGVNEPMNIDNNQDGTYTCTYMPSKSGQYTISIMYGGKPIPSSPFRVSALLTVLRFYDFKKVLSSQNCFSGRFDSYCPKPHLHFY